MPGLSSSTQVFEDTGAKREPHFRFATRRIPETEFFNLPLRKHRILTTVSYRYRVGSTNISGVYTHRP